MLIEVTEGARAPGSEPDKTCFMAKLQRLLVLEKTVKKKVLFNGFIHSNVREAASNLGDFLAAQHQVKVVPQVNNSSCHASWFYCAHKAREYITMKCLW